MVCAPKNAPFGTIQEHETIQLYSRRNLFGGESPIGKTITYHVRDQKIPMLVRGVFRDIPSTHSLNKRSDAVVSFTTPILEELEAEGVKPRQSRVITAGVDTDMFHPMEEPEGLRESMNLVGKRVIMCVGRLSFEKHVEQVVQSLRYLPDDVDLIIDGDGPASEYIAQVIKDEHQEDRVHLIGMVKREDLPKYYTMVQVCVSASRFETQGLSLMEAMACRVPIVVPNVRAFKEIIIDNENGFLFDGGIEDMAKRVTEALEISKDDRIRDAAMERAKSYSEDSSARKLVELYESVIEAKKRRLAEGRS